MDEVTVIIKCKEDPHVLETIESIDRPAEVIVALVPNPLLKAEIEAIGSRVLDAPDDNVGASCQQGLLAASNEACILTDSDTVFGPGYIQACVDALGSHEMCRGRIRFLHDLATRGSRTVARVRDFVNNVRHPPYMPGLGLRRSFAMRLGGFDQDRRWGVDHEFGTRAMASGARYVFLPFVQLDHLPIVPAHDLRAAFRTGRAQGGADRRSGTRDGGLLSGRVRSTVASIFHEPYAGMVRHGGATCALHHLRWISAYHRGYWQAMRETDGDSR